MEIKKEQIERIKSLTGYTLLEINNFTEGEFIRHIWKLYFKHVLTEDQYYWLRGYRELERKRTVDNSKDLGEVLGRFSGELL